MTREELDAIEAQINRAEDTGNYIVIVEDYIPALIAEVRRLADERTVCDRYQRAVDAAFQGNDSILPDFLLCGDDKADGIVRLAQHTKELRQRLADAEKVIGTLPKTADGVPIGEEEING